MKYTKKEQDSLDHSSVMMFGKLYSELNTMQKNIVKAALQ